MRISDWSSDVCSSDLVAQDQIGADRRDLIEARLAELALDVIFIGETETAVRLDAHVGGVPARLRREHLGHIRLGSAVGAGIEQARSLVDHQSGGGDLDISERARKENAMIRREERPV